MINYNYFFTMGWFIFLETLYILIILLVSVKIILDTDSSIKAAAYLLLIFLIPVIGIFIYFSFGLNYRKRELYSKKIILNEQQDKAISTFITSYINENNNDFNSRFPNYIGLKNMLFDDNINVAFRNNKVDLLINGEEKFSKLINSLQNAKHHIHIEYYIYENDEIGNKIANILIEKAKSGVKVRFIYDDFGSRKIRKTIVPRLIENGVEAFPFHKVIFIYFANRLNYRNHRKIVIIDGETAFIGGINVCDKYINNYKTQLFWRDTHLKIEGEGVASLQNIFLADWIFCSGQKLKLKNNYFNFKSNIENEQWVQIVSSGPDSPYPNILYSYMQAIASAKQEILITTPYFIPGQELIKILKISALRGVKVKLLTPGISDSFFVNAVSKSHYEDLLKNNIEIYLYKKGFVHAKTMVCDESLSFVGTANLDSRSFDLNFEVNAIIYDEKFAVELKKAFLNDISYAKKIDIKSWGKRDFFTRLIEKVLRLFAPLM